MAVFMFGLVMLQAAMLALEVYLVASGPTPLNIACLAFVSVMLVVTIFNWRRVVA